MFFEDAELLEEFLEESFDTIEVCHRALEEIFQGQDVSEGLNALFRGIHTIKGGSGMFAFEKTHQLAHSLENYLERLKSSAPSALSEEQWFYIQTEIDKIEKLLKSRDQENIEASSAPSDQHVSDEKSPMKTKLFIDFYHDFDQLFEDFNARELPQFELRIPKSLKEKAIEILEKVGCDCIQENKSDQTWDCLFIYEGSDIKQVDHILSKMSFLEEVNWIERFEKDLVDKGAVDRTPTSSPAVSVASPTEMLRVPLERVNQVLDNAWEMFLLSNQMSYLLEVHRPELKKNVAFMQAFESLEIQMKRNIEEIESRAMSMRMSTVHNIFNRMEKVVRGHSQESGKSIDFMTDGEHTELDKKVIDMLSDPLIHLVRNAMDHGIEDADTREMHGKKRSGSIELKAYVHGNSAFIEIRDDGKGMRPEKILELAKEKGVDVSEVETDQQAIELIFKPGFSTAQEVSSVSGRGVGMDAVKTSVEELGGSLSIETKEGEGSLFKIELPMGMSVIQALIVRVNNFLYAFNSEAILKTEKISIFDIKKNGDEEFYHYNGDYIPCVGLDKFFVDGDLERQRPINTETSVCVVRAGEDIVAVRVDEVLQSTGLVAKPVPVLSPSIEVMGGVSLLQSGDPVVILSVEKIIQEFLKGSFIGGSHERCA